MLNKFFWFLTIFFSLMLIFGIYIGYGGFITPLSAIMAIIFSLVLAFIIIKYLINQHKNSQKPIQKPWLVILSISGFILIFLLLLLPEFVFPVTCTDLMNHAASTRVIPKNQALFASGDAYMVYSGIPLIYIHAYPYGYSAVTSLLYALMGNSYIINSLLPFIFILLALIGIYLISIKTTNERIALFAVFISSFSIINLWVIEHGFLPQIMASFFLIAAIYAYLLKNKVFSFFAIIGLMAYPPLLVVYILFILLETGVNSRAIKDWVNSFRGTWHYLAIVLLAGLVVFPETIGLLWQYISVEKFWKGALLIRGGIYTPNFFGLLAFIPAILGIYLLIFKKKFNETKPVFSLILASFLMSCVVIVYFILNWFLTITEVKQVQSLYQAVKFFYFLLIPLSIYAAIGFDYLFKRFSKNFIKYVLIALLVFHFLYFMGYSFIILQKDSVPLGFYSIAEKIDALPPEFSVGVDECFTKSDKVEIPFIYKSLIDVPDPPGPNRCREGEISRALQFWWATHKAVEGKFRIYSPSGEEVVRVGDQNVDYFLTNCSTLNKPIVFEEGAIKVYKVR